MKQLSLFDPPEFATAEIKDFPVEGLRSAFKSVSLMNVEEIQGLTKNKQVPALLTVVAKNINKAYNTGDLKACDTLFKIIGLYEQGQMLESNQIASIEIVGSSKVVFNKDSKRIEIEKD
jgi:hypothetical protein